MKDYFYLKKGRQLLFALLVLLAGGASPAWADELTVYDGTATNEYLPIHGYYADTQGTASEFVIPAAGLADMKDKVIEQLTFYISSAASKKFGATFNVYLEEVEGDNYDDSSTSQLTNSKTLVYTGALDADGTTLVIPFDTEYTYNGGNLLIATEITTKGSYARAYFYGTTTTFNAGRCNKSSTKRYKFIPKTAFTYSAVSPYKKPASISVGEITTTTAVVSWTSGSGNSSETGWNLEYKKSTDENWTEVHGLGASPLSYTLSELDPNTTYDVRVQAVYSGGESKFAETTFKTAKVATPAKGFIDNFETDKGWDFVNVGTSSNSWVRGTATNNGGSSAMYISNDGGTSNAYATSGAMAAYAAKLFSFEAGDYTISYDWKANGESTYDFLRVALVPATDELNVTYSSIESSSLPSGWVELDGGSKLNLKTTWQNVTKDFTIAEAGNYQIVFAWRNDGNGGSNPPAAIDNFKILGSAPVLELAGDVVGTTLDFGSVSETTNKTITITNSGKVAMENIVFTETSDADNVFAYTTLPKTSLDASESMDVTVTFSGSSAKDYTGAFRVSADDCDPIDVTVTATYSNSPATMAITIDEAAVGETVEFGTVNKQAEKTFSVTNEGDQALNITSIVSSNTTDFTVSPATLTVAGGATETFTVTFLYDKNALDEEKTATITITPSNEGLSVLSFDVTGTRIDVWTEDFEGEDPLDGWESAGFTVKSTAGYNGAVALASNFAVSNYSSSNSTLITPLLQATAGDKLTFDAYFRWGNDPLIVEYSTDGTDWNTENPLYNFTGSPSFGENAITSVVIESPITGEFYLRFTTCYSNAIDNIEGFKLAPKKAHAVEVKDKTIPASGNQYVEYTASVDVKVTGTNDEQLTVKFFIGDTQYGEDVIKTVSAGTEDSFEFTFTPTSAISGDAYFTIESSDISAFETSKVAVTIAAAKILDETEAPELASGILPSVVLKYTAHNGWNTICMPFTLTTDILNSIFGEDWKAYEFKSYIDNVLRFETTTAFYAGYPYVIYVETAATHADGVILQNVNITQSSAKYDAYNSAFFRGTYAPVAAGEWTKNAETDDIYGITDEARIQKAGATASIDGFRAYFDLPSGASARLAFPDDGGQTTYIDANRLNNVEDGKAYNLQGQRVENLKKGLYIINGKKKVVRK